MNNIKDEKSIIRKKQKILRDKIYNNNPSHFALSLFNKLFEKINFQEINIISSFISINSEINMPFYKTKILNREISLEYEKKDEKKIIDSINLINEKIDDKLQNPKYSNGKISDTILLSLLSIELQAELSEKLNIERSSEVNDIKKQEYLKNNLELKDKILKLQNEKKILEDEKLKLDQEFDEINKKVEALIEIIKNSYYE